MRAAVAEPALLLSSSQQVLGGRYYYPHFMDRELQVQELSYFMPGQWRETSVLAPCLCFAQDPRHRPGLSPPVILNAVLPLPSSGCPALCEDLETPAGKTRLGEAKRSILLCGRGARLNGLGRPQKQPWISCIFNPTESSREGWGCGQGSSGNKGRGQAWFRGTRDKNHQEN